VGHEQGAKTRRDGDKIEIDWSIDSVAKLSPALMWLARPDGLATYLSDKWLRFVGRTMEDELGNGWAVSVHPEDMERCVGKYMDAVNNRRGVDLEFRLRRHDGAYRWILDHVQPRYSESGEFLGFIGTCLDVTELHAAKETIARQRDELAFAAKHDLLTNAYTRRYLFEQAEVEIMRLRRHGGQLHLMMLDVDKYKSINDTYGHKVGDEVLVLLVECLRNNVREVDHVCRYAGDEFCIILPETDRAGAAALAERVRASAQDLRLNNAPELRITLSIGLAEYANSMASVEDWIHRADSALYEAKKAGRNKVCTVEV
jgi:diguanylate cyclase (GGDEF)-like protein/PAS domain S-box-containing protein